MRKVLPFFGGTKCLFFSTKCAGVSYEVHLFCICTSQVLCVASDDDADMRDASVPAPVDSTNEAVGANALSASELFKTGAGGIDGHVHQRFMMNQEALVADATSNAEVGGTDCTIKEQSVDIGSDFFGRQMSVKGMTSFNAKEFAVDTIGRYHGGLISTLTNKALSLDPSLKRSEALTAAKINLG